MAAAAAAAAATGTTTDVTPPPLIPRLRLLRANSTIWTEEVPEPGDPYDLSRFVVLYDDQAALENVGCYVPITATYQCHFLRHKLPSYRATRYELFGFLADMQSDYAHINQTIRDAVKLYAPESDPPTVGLISLCRHSGMHVAEDKQAVLAYLLANMEGNLNMAWKTMLEWIGFEEDHWVNISDMFCEWVIPHLNDCFNPMCVKTVYESLSSMDDIDSTTTTDDREEIISQFSFNSDDY